MPGPFATVATQIDNATFDTRAALVPAPFGPLTRVDAMPDVTPNSNIPVGVTSAAPYSLAFEISYDDIDYTNFPDQVMARLINEHGIDGMMYVFNIWYTVFAANVAAITNWPKVTDTEFASVVNSLRLLEQLFAMVPRYRKDSFNHEEVLATPDFTIADAVAVNTADVTGISIVGDYDWVAWTSDSTVTTWTPSDVSDALTTILFDSTGAKEVTLSVAGPGGIKSVTKSVTIS